MVIKVIITFEESILLDKSPEDIVHPFLLVGNRKGFKEHLIGVKNE